MSPMKPLRAATAVAAEVSVEVAVHMQNVSPHVTVRFTDIPGCYSTLDYSEWERLVRDVAAGAAYVQEAPTPETGAE